MIKVMSLMKRKDGMTFEEFKDWLLDEHVAFARNLPGVRKYTVERARRRRTRTRPATASAELCFDSEAAMAEAFGTDAGKAAGGDAAAHCSNRVRLVCEEKLQF